MLCLRVENKFLGFPISRASLRCSDGPVNLLIEEATYQLSQNIDFISEDAHVIYSTFQDGLNRIKLAYIEIKLD